MKKVFIQHLQPDPEGPVFGRVIEPDDTRDIQDFLHDRVTRTIKDLLVAGVAGAQVVGFAATVTAGLGVEIAAGDVVDANGVSYELDALVEKILGAADPALPRIDRIYGTLSVDAEAELELRPHRRLRTQAELEANLEPYPPTQFNVPTEKHTKLTVNVRAGVPNADPQPPALNAGEVPLWRVRVDAGETDLAPEDLTDERVLMKSLWQVLQDVIALQGLVTQAGIREMVEDIVGAFASSPDGSLTVTYNDAGNAFTITLNNDFVTEKIQDVVAALASSPDSSIGLVYDDAANTWTLQLAGAYKALLDGATSAATASTLMKRDANADVQTRDFKPTRQIVFPDSSKKTKLREPEEYISILDLFAPAINVSADAYALLQADNVNNGVLNYAPVIGELWIDPADYANVPFSLEAKFFPGAGEGVTLQLYNLTDNAEVCVMNRSNTGSGSEEVSRSALFNLAGSGRKRLVLRHKRQTVGIASTMYIWRARLVANPMFTDCGHSGQPSCSL